MKKDPKVIIIGHVNHERTCLSAALAKAMLDENNTHVIVQDHKHVESQYDGMRRMLADHILHIPIVHQIDLEVDKSTLIRSKSISNIPVFDLVKPIDLTSKKGKGRNYTRDFSHKIKNKRR